MAQVSGSRSRWLLYLNSAALLALWVSCGAMTVAPGSDAEVMQWAGVIVLPVLAGVLFWLAARDVTRNAPG